MVFNLVFAGVIWGFFPETTGRGLEEGDIGGWWVGSGRKGRRRRESEVLHGDDVVHGDRRIERWRREGNSAEQGISERDMAVAVEMGAMRGRRSNEVRPMDKA